MLDYLIAITVALVGLAVMYFVFVSISSADVAVAGRTAVDRKPRCKKQSRGPSRKYKEDVLDHETERLIAEELARNPSGLSTDTKVVEPTTLEEVRSRHHDREHGKHTQAAATIAQTAPLTERQRLIDKELGFQQVEKKLRKEKKEKPAEKQWSAVDEDDMDRKLAIFFRNTKNRNRQVNRQHAEEESPSSAAAGTGGRVEIKGDLTNTRAWQQQ